jgi:uncharacterized lipoprotein
MKKDHGDVPVFRKIQGEGDDRVQVSPETTGSQVHVLNKDGGEERSKTAHRILTLLHEQLK